jgi:ATPase subunit of ABC transporter with duplicated ATPase domains
MLALSNISLRRGRNVLIENASFQIHAGQRMGVIGANGCGKSSLFAMFLGELEPDDGELVLDPRHEIAHVAQESPRGTGSAIDYVMDGDRELRQVQAAIAEGEAAAETPDLHILYERMEAIDGFSTVSGSQQTITPTRLNLSPAVGACGSISPAHSCAGPISCCSTNRPTISICQPSCGSSAG